MKYVGETLDYEGNFIDVYECELCGFREKARAEISCKKCVHQHHMEEAQAGIL
jgi:Zn ribbon nucleic-acid-binding protein